MTWVSFNVSSSPPPLSRDFTVFTARQFWTTKIIIVSSPLLMWELAGDLKKSVQTAAFDSWVPRHFSKFIKFYLRIKWTLKVFFFYCITVNGFQTSPERVVCCMRSKCFRAFIAFVGCRGAFFNFFFALAQPARGQKVKNASHERTEKTICYAEIWHWVNKDVYTFTTLFKYSSKSG